MRGPAVSGVAPGGDAGLAGDLVDTAKEGEDVMGTATALPSSRSILLASSTAWCTPLRRCEGLCVGLAKVPATGDHICVEMVGFANCALSASTRIRALVPGSAARGLSETLPRSDCDLDARARAERPSDGDDDASATEDREACV